MKKLILIIVSGIFFMQLSAQKKLQTLQPSRLGIFKNGTCFVKREGTVTVTEKSFYIKAPEKVLMGTYWIFVGKDQGLQSLVVKTDTFKISRNAKSLSQFLEANVGQNITLSGNADNPELRKITGKLLQYDVTGETIKMETANGKTIVANSDDFNWVETSGTLKDVILTDHIVPIAKVKLKYEADNALVSTISLEKGVQWYPSYLFTVINDKEARLDMKATISNSETEYLNMPVDIIIGNPEMFYGQALDPVCIRYLNESLGAGYSSNSFSNTLNVSNVAMQTSSSSWASDSYDWNNSNDEPGKEGQKLEDLYYYQLGVIDLEKNSKVIVPVMGTNISYSEIYTADLPLNSTTMEGSNSIQTYHSYLVNNNTSAPLTSGAVLVMNASGQPLAQSQLNYTSVKSSSELKLSKAIDVQVKNDEEETGREKTNEVKTYPNYFTKASHKGTINIANYKDKKITIRITKRIDGVFIKADNNGKSRKIKTRDDDDTIAELYWLVEVAAGAKMQLQYNYFTLD